MKYVDASAVLRLLFAEPGPSVVLSGGDWAVSSELVEVETFRAFDRERLLGNLDDRETALKHKERPCARRAPCRHRGAPGR